MVNNLPITFKTEKYSYFAENRVYEYAVLRACDGGRYAVRPEQPAQESQGPLRLLSNRLLAFLIVG